MTESKARDDAGQAEGGEAAEVGFEAAVGRLEEVVKQLELGEVSLAEAMRLFEEGVGLARRCSELLSVAERRIELLVERSDGTFDLAPLADAGDDRPTQDGGGGL